MEKQNSISCKRLFADEVQIQACRKTLAETSEDLNKLYKILILIITDKRHIQINFYLFAEFVLSAHNKSGRRESNPHG